MRTPDPAPQARRSFTAPATDALSRDENVVADGFWAGSNLTTVQRIAGLVWAVGIAISLPFVAAFPPTDWDALATVAVVAWPVVTLAGALGCLVPGLRRSFGFAAILTTAGVELAVLTVLQASSGGWAAPYYQLIGIHAVVIAACFPSRAAIPFIVVSVLISLSPAATGDVAGRAGDVGLNVTTWVGVCVIGLIAMRRVRAQRLGLTRDARIDRLTQLGNRRSFETDAADRLRISRQEASSLAVGLGDLDRFKRVNDDHGHLAGDACLTAAAEALRDACGDQGVAFRWAGDEFAVIVWATDAPGLQAAQTRIETATRSAARTPWGDPVAMTIGWATDTRQEPELDTLLAIADDQLLARKRAGRTSDELDAGRR